MSEQEKTELIKAKRAVLERMQAIGWITGFRIEGDHAHCELTPEGRATMQQVERLFFHGGKPLNPTEMTAFCYFIKTFENL